MSDDRPLVHAEDARRWPTEDPERLPIMCGGDAPREQTSRSNMRAVTCSACLTAIAAGTGLYAAAAASRLADLGLMPRIDPAETGLREAMTKLANAATGIEKESAAAEAIACWRTYETARRSDGPERFTVDDRRVLRKLLTPPCCHVTGEHDPRHYMTGYGPCEIQQATAYTRAIENLGLPRFTGGDGRPEPECGWCNRPAAEIAAERSSGGALVISDETARAVNLIVDKALATCADGYDELDIERILIVDNPTNSFASIRALTVETRRRWSAEPDGPIARICKTIEKLEEIEPVTWNEERLRFEVDAMPGVAAHERGYGSAKLSRPARAGRTSTELELRCGRLHLMWPTEGPSGT